MQASALPPTLLLIPCLDTNPRIFFKKWEKAVLRCFADVCTMYSPHGLLGYILGDAEWAARPGNNAATPRPVFPVYIDITEAMTNVQQAAGTASNTRLRDLTAGWKFCQDAYIAGLAEHRQAYENQATGLIDLTIQALHAAVKVDHGTITSSDFEELDVILDSPLVTESRSTFIAYTLAMTEIFNIKLESGNADSNKVQLDYLRRGIAFHPYIATAFQDYVDANPLLADRSFANASTFITTRLNNYTGVTAATMGFSALATTNRTTPRSYTQAEFDARYQQGRKDGRAGGSSAKSGAGGGGPSNNPYCYKHGKVGHLGKDCDEMNTSARSSTYTAEMRQARFPADVKNCPHGNTKNC